MRRRNRYTTGSTGKPAATNTGKVPVDPAVLPETFKLCLQDTPEVYELFLRYPEREKIAIIQWIYSAKKEQTKVQRILKAINDMALSGKVIKCTRKSQMQTK